MAELLTVHPDSFLIALVLAIGVDLVWRAFRSFGGAARRFWSGPETAQDVRPFWAIELLSYLLYFPLAILAFVPPLVLVVVVAVLMGFDPDVKLAALAHGLLLLWTLVAVFIWIQVGHLLSLSGFWRRLRYLLLLAAIPMLLQALAWETFDGVFRLRLLETEDLKLLSQVSKLLCLGLLPFLMPFLHARVLVPVFSFVTDSTAHRWRTAVTILGTVALVGLVVFAVWSIDAAGRSTMFARPQASTTARTAPVAIGAPHTCNQSYPEQSQRLGEQGRTVVVFRVTSQGTVRDVVVARSSGSPRLDLAAVLCVTHWTYRPAMVNGQRVEVSNAAVVIWKLEK